MSKYYQVYQNGMPKNVWLKQIGQYVIKVELNTTSTGIYFTNLENSGFQNELNGISTNGKSLEFAKEQMFNKVFNEAEKAINKLGI